jgi:hypothetical protein
MTRAVFGKVAPVTLAVAIGITVPSYAQRGMGRGTPKYDKATEVKVKGTVEEVKEYPSPMGWNGTHAMLKAEGQTLDVHLGPSDFLKEKGFVLEAGDGIEVTGSRVKYESNDTLLAREVKKADMTLTLRNAQGIPVWSRSRRR